MRRLILMFVGFLASSCCFAEKLDFVPDELKSFISDSKATKQITSESNYYSALGFEISAVRDKYPEKFTAENYLDYFDELNDVLIKAKSRHRNVEDVLLDKVNLLRQQWFDALQKQALREVFDAE